MSHRGGGQLLSLRVKKLIEELEKPPPAK
jgi:hypothetical protein